MDVKEMAGFPVAGISRVTIKRDGDDDRRLGHDAEGAV